MEFFSSKRRLTISDFIYMSTGLEVRSMVFPIYNNFTGIKSNYWVVQAAVTGESFGACDERFTRNDLQISKECSVKITEAGGAIVSAGL
jgi:hypothetical protein